MQAPADGMASTAAPGGGGIVLKPPSRSSSEVSAHRARPFLNRAVNDSVSVRLEDSFRSLPPEDSVSVVLERASDASDAPPPESEVRSTSKAVETAPHVSAAAHAAIASASRTASANVLTREEVLKALAHSGGAASDA